MNLTNSAVFVMLFFIGFISFGQTNEMNINASAADSCSHHQFSTVIVGNIHLTGNKVTKEKIIMRELEFRQGDTLNADDFCRLIQTSRLNLLNRSIFNFVTVDTIHDRFTPGVIHLEFNFIERWYIWPLPIFELADRNFNAWFNTGKYSRVNYGMLFTHNNFRGRLEQLRILVRAGFNQNVYVRYDIPYLTRKQTFGIGFLMGFSRSHEAPIATIDEKQLFFKPSHGFARENYYGGLVLTYRPAIRNSHSLTLTYDTYRFADSVILLNPDYSLSNANELNSINIAYQFRTDYRDYKPYPLVGHYFNFDLNFRHLFDKNEFSRFIMVKTTFDFYAQLTKKFYWASNLTSRFSTNHTQPYFLPNGFGFNNDLLRSYELYVVEGFNWGIMKNNLKFELLAPRVSKIGVLKSEKFSKIHYAFYLNVFSDLGYVAQSSSGAGSELQNKLLIGSGLGLDFVTYYDLVFRLEYGMNHRKEAGWFIHFVAPI